MTQHRLNWRLRGHRWNKPRPSLLASAADAAADDGVDDPEAQCPRGPLIGEFLLIQPKTNHNSIELTPRMLDLQAS
jgi:hypothetical protein